MDEYIRRIGQRLVIIPAWYYDSYAAELTLQPTDLPIVLDPGQTFGAGSHSTTQMCLALLETYLRPADSVLDLGCGSGILSLAAAKLGAGSVQSIDIDPEAGQVTLANAARNDLAQHIRFSLGSLEVVPGANYQMIVANLFAYLLTDFLNRGLAKRLAPQGLLILSGILHKQLEQVTNACSAAGLSVIAQQESDDDWVAIAAQKI